MTKIKAVFPFHIHPLLWAIVAIALLTASFIPLMAIFTLVFIHEMGHFGMARFFKWRVRSIMLWPFGGVMETEEFHSRPVHEEALVILAGPFQHVWLYGAILAIGDTAFFPSSVISLLLTYNTLILFFNLLPIWPLDGGKLLFLMLSYRFPFVKAQQYIIGVSLVLIGVGLAYFLWAYPFSLSTILLASFIIWENRLEWKQRHFAFLRFLMKRNDDTMEKIKRIEPIYVSGDTPVMQIFSKFKRGCHHKVFVSMESQQRSVMDEKECLYAFFSLKQSQVKAKDLAELFGA